MKKQVFRFIAFAALFLVGLAPVAIAQGTQGPAATGKAPIGNPVYIAGWDGTYLRGFLTDANGRLLIGNFPSSTTVSNFPSSFNVGNFPSTFGVSSLPALPTGSNAIGSVSVSNLPATQAVTQSGTWTNTVTQPTGSNLHVQVDSAPTTTVTGSVVVSSLPALPTGSNAIGSVSVSNFPGTQPVSGTVSISGTPSVTVSSLPALATGGNTIGAVNINGTVPISGSITASNPSVATSAGAQPTSATLIGGSDGANLRPISTDSGGKVNVNVIGNVTSVSGGIEYASLSAGANNTDLVSVSDATAYKSWSFQIGSTAFSGTISWQTSNDGVNWMTTPGFQSTATTGASTGSSGATNTLWAGPVIGKMIRWRTTSYTSGTMTGTVELSTLPFSSWVLTSNGVTGTVSIGNSANTTPALFTEASAVSGWTYANITTNTTSTVKSGSGRLRSITINNPGSGASAIVYDNTTGTGTKLATLGGLNGPTTLVYDAQFSTGLTIVTSATTTAADITVSYK
ncbi:MAG: hypothetical protein ABIY70_21240 [Capsulimonas sp.]|uniref:hypothetical protein n=1 Tax=Capsulimonas sp. TaxID=2494211 RepID=UPI0032654C33